MDTLRNDISRGATYTAKFFRKFKRSGTSIVDSKTNMDAELLGDNNVYKINNFKMKDNQIIEIEIREYILKDGELVDTFLELCPYCESKNITNLGIAHAAMNDKLKHRFNCNDCHNEFYYIDLL